MTEFKLKKKIGTSAVAILIVVFGSIILFIDILLANKLLLIILLVSYSFDKINKIIVTTYVKLFQSNQYRSI